MATSPTTKTTQAASPKATTPKATPTPQRSNADLARELIDRLNARDFDGLAALQHDDVFDDFVAVGEYRGKPAVRRFFEEMFAAFPDFRIDVQRVTASGDMAVVEWRSAGTFTGGPFQGIHANGKYVSLRGVDCMRFEEGRLRHNTIYYDAASFARAVGLLPPVGSGMERAMTGAFNAVTSVRRALKL